MLYWLLYPLHTKVSWLSWLRVMGYPSFRILAAFSTALAIGIAIGPRLIAWLRWKQHGISNVREDTPESHQKKKGTPTLGGLLILFALTVSTLLFADIRIRYVIVALIVTLGYGFTGWLDDWLKMSKRSSKGLPGRYKLILQTVFVLGAFYGLFLDTSAPGWLALDTHVTLPFVPTRVFNPNLGWLYVPFALFIVIVGTSNAVNLTDGLDGLAAGPTAVSASLFTLLAYVAGVRVRVQVPSIGGEIQLQTVADYLHVPHVEGAQELAIFAAAVAGAVVAFLWFNAYPAEVFMGDVGALALGGALGTLAVLTKNEVMSAIVHGVFLTETISVMVQVASFKLTGKRVFKMAPIHHHFEKVGWPEPKIIVRFWIISIMLAIVGVASLKLR